MNKRNNALPAARMGRRGKVFLVCGVMAVTAAMVLLSVNPAFATSSNYVSTIRNIMNNMVSIVGVIFQAVGVILSIYAVGQLILAFKNDDPNGKSAASTLLVVGIVLIAVPQIIRALNLVNMIGGS